MKKINIAGYEFNNFGSNNYSNRMELITSTDRPSEIFKKVKPYKNVKETFIKLKEAGYKVAILSDFPPEQKGDIWGVLPYCDGVYGAEHIGALKPSKYT